MESRQHWRGLLQQLCEELERLQAESEELAALQECPRKESKGSLPSDGEHQESVGELADLDRMKLSGDWDLIADGRRNCDRGDAAALTSLSPAMNVDDVTAPSMKLEEPGAPPRAPTEAPEEPAPLHPSRPRVTIEEPASERPRRLSKVAARLQLQRSRSGNLEDNTPKREGFNRQSSFTRDGSNGRISQAATVVSSAAASLISRQNTGMTLADVAAPVLGQFKLVEDWEDLMNEMQAAPSQEPCDETTKRRGVHHTAGYSEEKKGFTHWIERLIMSPVCFKRFVWNVASGMLLLYDALVIPMQLIDFEYEDTELTMWIFWVALTFWSADIPMTFCTGTYLDNTLEMRPQRIAFQYLRSWFSVDLIALLPDWIIIFVLSTKPSGSLMRSVKVFKLLRVLRVLKLLRFLKFRGSFGWVMERINSEYTATCMKLLVVMSLISMINHYLACLWFALSRHVGEPWMLQLNSESIPYLYLSSFHWSLSQFHGTMEVTPSTVTGRAFAIVVQFFGLVASAIFISSVTNVMTQLQRLHFETFRRHRLLMRYLHTNSIRSDLSAQIKRYCRQVAVQNNNRNADVELIDVLPDSLRSELMIEVHRPALDSHRLLYDVVLKSDSLKKVVCSSAIRKSLLLPGEMLFTTEGLAHEGFGRNDRTAPRMFYIRSGSLSYVRQEVTETGEVSQRGSGQKTSIKSFVLNGTGLMTSQKGLRTSLNNALGAGNTEGKNYAETGQCICEMSLWTTWRNRGDAAADKCCEVFAFDGTLFAAEIRAGRFRMQAERVVEYARRYVTWMNTIEDSDMHDLAAPSGTLWP